MSDKNKKSDKDVINIEGVGTDNQKTWVTIKDASDLLGYSERHTWRIATKNRWKTKKLLNNFRRKVYVLRDQVETFYKEEQERQRLDQLKSDTYDKSGINDEYDKSDKAMSDKSEKMSDSVPSFNVSETLPMLLSEYKNQLVSYKEKHEKLIQDNTFWKTSALWLIGFVMVVSGFLGYYIYDTKVALSDSKTALSDKDKDLQGLIKRVDVLADKVIEKQESLFNTQNDINLKDNWIKTLEETLTDSKLEKLRGLIYE